MVHKSELTTIQLVEIKLLIPAHCFQLFSVDVSQSNNLIKDVCTHKYID